MFPAVPCENAKMVAEMDFVVERTDHCMETEKGVGEDGLAGFWRGCLVQRGCEMVELSQEFVARNESICKIVLPGVCENHVVARDVVY